LTINADKSTLTLTPADADPSMELTVTTKLVDYLTVTQSEDITINVSGFTTADAPINVANNALITNKTKIGLTWSPGLSNGGKAVIDYRVSWD